MSVCDYVHKVNYKYNLYCTENNEEELNRLLKYVFDEYGDFIFIPYEKLIISEPRNGDMNRKLRETREGNIETITSEKMMRIYDNYFNFEYDKKIVWLTHDLIHTFVFSEKVNQLEIFINIDLLDHGRSIDDIETPRNKKIHQFHFLMSNFNEFLADTYIYTKNKELFDKRVNLLFNYYNSNIESWKVFGDPIVLEISTLIFSYHKFIENFVKKDLEKEYHGLKENISNHIKNSGRYSNPNHLINKCEEIVDCYVRYDEKKLEEKFYEIIEDDDIIFPSGNFVVEL